MTPVTVWLVVVGLFTAALLVKGTVWSIHHLHGLHINHVITIGSEREELFVPGDSTKEEDVINDEE